MSFGSALSRTSPVVEVTGRPEHRDARRHPSAVGGDTDGPAPCAAAGWPAMSSLPPDARSRYAPTSLGRVVAARERDAQRVGAAVSSRRPDTSDPSRRTSRPEPARSSSLLREVVAVSREVDHGNLARVPRSLRAIHPANDALSVHVEDVGAHALTVGQHDRRADAANADAVSSSTARTVRPNSQFSHRPAPFQSILCNSAASSPDLQN